MTRHPNPRLDSDIRLSRQESMRLLQIVTLGRIAFISRALPAIRLVSHIVQDGNIIIGTSGDPEISAILNSPGASLVVYEADMVDTTTHLGWSVVAGGRAVPVTDPEEIATVRPRIRGWAGSNPDLFVRIKPELVTGFHVGDGNSS